MLYVLAYPAFSPETANRLDKFRAAHESARASLVRPHVTLVFGLTNVNSDDFLNFAARAVQEQGSFNVTFDRCSVNFDPYDKTYKLMLECGIGQERLDAIHTALYAGPYADQWDNDADFRPHMTVATNESQRLVASADTKELGAFPLNAKVQSLEVVSLADDQLTTVGVIPLLD